MRYEVSAQYVPWGERGTDEVYWRLFVVQLRKMNRAPCSYVSDIYMSLLSGALPGDV